MTEACPPIEVLYALATDDEASPEVRRHIAACTPCQKQIAEVKRQSTTMRQLVAAAGPPLPALPDHPSAIGKYVIVGIISDDADAVCYRALHSMLHVEVSILVGKQFKAASPAEQEPLIYTARPLLGVEHPGVARVRDIGFLDGAPYLVHDYVSGRRLDRLSKDEPLAMSAIVQGGDQILSALAALQRGRLPHGRLGMRSLVGTDRGELLIVDLGRAWLCPTQPINSDVQGAGEIFYQLLTHVPPAERGKKYEGFQRLCRQAMASPMITSVDFWEQWGKVEGLIPWTALRVIAIFISVTFGALICVLVIAFVLMLINALDRL